MKSGNCREGDRVGQETIAGDKWWMTRIRMRQVVWRWGREMEGTEYSTVQYRRGTYWSR